MYKEEFTYLDKRTRKRKTFTIPTVDVHQALQVMTQEYNMFLKGYHNLFDNTDTIILSHTYTSELYYRKSATCHDEYGRRQIT